MIRIVGQRKSGPTDKTDKALLTVLQLIGIIVADHPKAIQNLLENYGLNFSSKPTEIELIQNLFQGIARKDEKFNTELAAVIMLSLLEKAGGKKDEEDNFNYAEAISGAIGTAGNVFNQHLKNKGDKDQLTGQTMQQMMAYKQQRQMTDKTKNNWIKPVAVIFGGLVLMGMVLWFYNNKRATQTANILAQ